MNPHRVMTIGAAASEIRAGRLSPLELVERCLGRIERFESRVKAWVLVDTDGAREAARCAGEELAAGRDRGVLHGIPIGLKDLVDVAGWPTLAGSRLRAGHRAEHDATIVTRLRNAGAVLLGKTVTTEFASFDPPPTRNPWNLEHTPGGSSSGSAAAVATGMCLAAIGSQTGGSITRPASFCGVAGCKPTFGRVSGHGIVPLSRHMDHVGPLARSVGGLAAVLRVIAGLDAADAATIDVPVGDFSQACQAGSPPRLGLVADAFFAGASDAVRAATRTAQERLSAAGARCDVIRLPEEFAAVTAHHRRMMAVEAAEYHESMFRQHSREYGPHIRMLIEEGLAASGVDYAHALVHRRQLQRDLLSSFGEFDALVTPATTTTAPEASSTGDPKFNSPWSYVGFPTISVPCGLAADGLPVSLQFVGRPFDEARLFGAAAWCESVLAFDELPPLVAAT
ncbi:MAG TPA: amidase [Pirellulales bacterium]|nr:amidase [Pirellulales bacterium]